MSDTQSDSPSVPAPDPAKHRARGRRRRWAFRFAFALLALLAGGVIALPLLMESGGFRRIVLSRVNEIYAPSRVTFERLRFSWFAPTRIEGLVVIDDEGREMVQAGTAVWERSVLEIFRKYGKGVGKVVLKSPKINIARLANGSIDLSQTLSRSPMDGIRLEFEEGVLKVDAAELPAPLLADRFYGYVEKPAAPAPITWFLQLAKTDQDGSPSLTLRGRLERSLIAMGGIPRFFLDVGFTNWPVELKIRDSDVRANVHGSLVLAKPEDRFEATGRLSLLRLKAESLGIDIGDEPCVFEFGLGFDEQSDVLAIERLRCRYRDVDAFANGTIADFKAKRVFDLSGKVVANWDSLVERYVKPLDPNAQAEFGNSRFHVGGDLSQGPGSLNADAAIEVVKARFQGLRLGATKIEVQKRGKDVRIEPIRAEFNGGRLVLAPKIETETDSAGESVPVMLLDSQSSLRELVVDDELSSRWLSYVAPVLSGATRVSGKVSVDVAEARLPLGKSDKKAKFEGDVRFNDVTFKPGPLASEVFDALNVEKRPVLRLNDPVNFEIADGRVTQRGFTIPIANISRVGFAGWVDFDKNLAMNVSAGMAPELIPGRPLLNQLVEGARITIPIGGTLDKPKVDSELFKAEMKSVGTDLARRGAILGIGGLLKLLTEPKPDPPPTRRSDRAAPPPPAPKPPRPTAEERKAERIRKQEERKEQRMKKREERREKRLGLTPGDES